MSDPLTHLYRLIGDDGALLYIGISDNWLNRMHQHRKEKPWFCDVVEIRLQNFASRKEALVAERDAIHAERPIHNVRHNTQRERKSHDFRLQMNEAMRQWADETRERILQSPTTLALTVYDAAEVMGMPFPIFEGIIRRGDIPVIRGRDRNQLVLAQDLVNYVDAIAAEVAP